MLKTCCLVFGCLMLGLFVMARVPASSMEILSDQEMASVQGGNWGDGWDCNKQDRGCMRADTNICLSHDAGAYYTTSALIPYPICYTGTTKDHCVNTIMKDCAEVKQCYDSDCSNVENTSKQQHAGCDGFHAN